MADSCFFCGGFLGWRRAAPWRFLGGSWAVPGCSRGVLARFLGRSGAQEAHSLFALRARAILLRWPAASGARSRA
eukprot:7723441-Alexandrium_andersonii.AAC.1